MKKIMKIGSVHMNNFMTLRCKRYRTDPIYKYKVKSDK